MPRASGNKPNSARRREPRRRRRPLGIAFVCYGNACRSQMAEAWARYYGPGRVVAQSAGVHPLGLVTSETHVVMAEKGIRLDGHHSKGLDALDWKQVDVLVNMAPYPADSLRAGFSGRTVTWDISDPFLRPLATYRQVRDELDRRVRALVDELMAPAAPACESL